MYIGHVEPYLAQISVDFGFNLTQLDLNRAKLSLIRKQIQTKSIQLKIRRRDIIRQNKRGLSVSSCWRASGGGFVLVQLAPEQKAELLSPALGLFPFTRYRSSPWLPPSLIRTTPARRSPALTVGPSPFASWDMGTLNSLWLLTRKSVTGALFGITVSDRYLTVSPVRGNSMHPTFASSSTTFPGYLKGDLVLIERFCLHDFKFSHGDVVIFQSPSNHKQIYVKRLIALPGEWIRVSSDMLKIPDGHCWVEGDNSSSSLDSRYFGPIPLGLIRGRVTHVIWPPQRVGKVERKMRPGRIYQD
ncbi:hypothetical protein IEQ34_021194 [Dendrobium chrysotoxum]|uniref:Mitochondrial inner membrane protease subunit 2 n=1 Tax=Dendrobium chrysotoxum TaxID=161865 RepID=A0AAV7G452_DENCH|nr:hypothetical protein IEQ34_021194 [Dendrobium chrysotoxum]